MFEVSSIERSTISGNVIGIALSGADHRIEGSSILDNAYGVDVGAGATGIVISDNYIAGNITVGVRNRAVDVVNAELNYWGAADGPSPIGTGDAISGNVDAVPFLTAIPASIDTTPPEILGVDVSTDLTSLIVQLDDDDLDEVLAETVANYKLTAAGVDGVFDRNVVIDSIVYDAATDVITVQTSETLFDEVFRLAIDGDDSADGTPGVTDQAGNFLSGGDFIQVLDLTALSLVDDTLTTLEDMGLATGTEHSLVGRLEAAVHLLGVEVGNDTGVLALLDAFKRGVLRQFDRGEITADQRDDLLTDADLIILGITLTAA